MLQRGRFERERVERQRGAIAFIQVRSITRHDNSFHIH